MGKTKPMTTTKSANATLMVESIDEANNQLMLVPAQASQLTDEETGEKDAQIHTSPIMMTLPSVEGYAVGDRLVVTFQI